MNGLLRLGPPALLALAAAVLSGCGASLRAEFRSTSAAATPAIASPEQVRIHYGLVDGFALQGSDLVVLPGFDHRVLGLVTVLYDKGMCDSSHADKNTVLGVLRQTTFERGGDAVVLAWSALKDKPGFWDVCSVLGKPFGHGWAVRVGAPRGSGDK